MAFIKEESEDIRIAEVFSIKHEDTEEQTGGFFLKAELSHDSYSQYSSTEMNNIYEQYHDFPNCGFYLTWARIHKDSKNPLRELLI